MWNLFLFIEISVNFLFMMILLKLILSLFDECILLKLILSLFDEFTPGPLARPTLEATQTLEERALSIYPLPPLPVIVMYNTIYWRLIHRSYLSEPKGLYFFGRRPA